MEVGTEVGQVVVIGDAVIKSPNLGVVRGPMKGHLRLRGLDPERGVSNASIGTIEPAPQRMCVAEGGVHDPRVGNGKYQFMQPDPRKQTGLSQQPVVRGALEFGEIVEVRIIVGNA